MTKLKTTISLNSTDMFAVPISISHEITVTGSGDGQSYNKTTSPTYVVGTDPTALPIGVFNSTDKRVYVYIINKSSIDGEDVNIYVQITGPAYHKISILNPGEYIFLPLANNDYIYTDAVVGTPTIEFLILEK
jgi:hypothetical protein|tara:strand:+ start:519 stop:917 length:399 start_codon:yes stop_codon:yes gene_type:complete